MRHQARRDISALLTGCWLVVGSMSTAADWANWRGPYRNGTSPETELVESWSTEGENLLWRHDFVGRSTPVVFNGRACANGRVGEGILRQEMVACFDAETGTQLWEYRFNVYQTTVPWTRVGWANLTGDPETGFLYVQGVAGLFFCLDSRDGRVVWWRNFIEEFGFMEGYGGRTQTPTLDGDRVVITFANTSWGNQARPLHRTFAFDKRSGELLWVATPASSMADKNSQSTPAIALIDGQRLTIHGNGDGSIYALQAATGVKVWEFKLSQRAINTSVVIDGSTVYAAHSEENVDEPSMGRVVAIDGSGSGDVTSTHEMWRAPLGVGFSTPALQHPRLFVLDNSANLHVLDADDGKVLWSQSLGTVGKGSPVVADGKLYATEVNGRFHILRLGEQGADPLDVERIRLPSGRYAEIYGSPAIAYGRIFFTTEEGIYCLGDPRRPFRAAASPPTLPTEEPAAADADIAVARITPAEIHIGTSDMASFQLHVFDGKGRSLGVREAEWAVSNLAGSITDGRFEPDPDAGSQAGEIIARAAGLEASARVRVLAPLPFSEDFETTEVGSRPSYLLGYVGTFRVTELEGNAVLFKGPSPLKIHRHITFLGSHRASGYTIAGDLKGTREARTMPDMGLINSGYTLDLMGNHQRLEIRSWASALRMVTRTDFSWSPDVWYRMKLRVDIVENRALIRGKVWPKNASEPEEWLITAEDPLPIRAGSPGLYGYSPTPIYYDNIEVINNPS